MEQILVFSMVLLWIVVLFNMLLTFGLIRRIKSEQSFNPFEGKGLDSGISAPDFVALNLQNQEVSMADYTGQSVAFVFVSPHCQPCHQIIPDLEILAPNARNQGIELVLITDSSVMETKDFVTQLDIKLPILSAPRDSNKFLDTYKVAGTPFYSLIDGDGTVTSAGFLGPQWQSIAEKWSSN